MKKIELTLTDQEASMLNELLHKTNEQTKDYFQAHGLNCTDTNANEVIGSWITKKYNEVFKK